jgi:hypothetical protein
VKVLESAPKSCAVGREATRHSRDVHLHRNVPLSPLEQHGRPVGSTSRRPRVAGYSLGLLR